MDPAGAPGSNWVSPPLPDDAGPPIRTTSTASGRRSSAGRRAAAQSVARGRRQPAVDRRRRGRHSAPPEPSIPDARRATHVGRRPARPPPHAEPEPPSRAAAGRADGTAARGQHTGGQSVAELLARLQADPAGAAGADAARIELVS